jgi:hypothetical protein
VIASAIVAWMAIAILLHPGHSTRVEVQYNPSDCVIELAMRIDHGDLEAALRSRYDKPLVLERMTDEDAVRWLAPYLQETLRLDGKKLSKAQFNWVGWERKRISTWVYVELSIVDKTTDRLPASDRPPTEVELAILTLLETEPELNHVVTLIDGEKRTTIVTTRRKPTAIIPITQASTP